MEGRKAGGRLRLWALAPLWLLGILAVLMASLRLIINDRDYFLNIYTKLDMERRIGISPEDCADAMMAMVGYMEGARDSIQLEVTELGQQVAMFNQQEIDHMVDVRNLYQGFCHIQTAGMLVLAALLLAGIWGLWKKRPWAAGLAGSWWLGLGLFGCILLGLGAYAAVDFNAFWTSFHHVFFTNDLWLMDYATCRMIRICPLGLFSGIILRFTCLGLGLLALLSLFMAVLARRGRRV